jgi:hypothetical protein
MNGFDVQSALEVAKKIRGIARRADTFGHDRARLIEEILFYAENMENLAARIEENMEDEYRIEMLYLVDSDGAACNMEV